MGLLERLFGWDQPPRRADPETAPGALSDEQAIARYRYLLRTAQPEAIEQAHAEAFARLTPEQRVQILRQLGEELPAGEQVEDPRQADPRALARTATRAEMRRPGTLERSLGGVGVGGLFAGSLLSTVAGAFIGTAIATQLLGGADVGGPADQGGPDTTEGESPGAEEDAGFGDAGDLGGGDFDV